MRELLRVAPWRALLRDTWTYWVTDMPARLERWAGGINCDNPRCPHRFGAQHHADRDCPACRGAGSVPDGADDGTLCDCVQSIGATRGETPY